jgi:hypothetical protein
MKRLWIAAALVLAAAATGCNRWDEYPEGNPYYQPYYQQPYYQQPVYQQPCQPVYQQSAATYTQPAANPCAPATVRTAPTR